MKRAVFGKTSWYLPGFILEYGIGLYNVSGIMFSRSIANGSFVNLVSLRFGYE